MMFYIALVTTIVWNVCYILRHRVFVSNCKSKAKLAGKTAIVTGANSGIGLETAKDLYRRGARVILACRDPNRAREAVSSIIKKHGSVVEEVGELVVYLLDLSSLKSVREFCDQIKEEEAQINLLVNNAGIYNHPPKCTEDDLEIHMAVNHLGHFLLTNLLMDKLKSSAPSRVVTVGSHLYGNGLINFEKLVKGESNPNSHQAYNNSKLAIALFVRHFNLKYPPSESGVSIFYADPGIVLTNIDRHTIPGFLQTVSHFILSACLKYPQEGCQTLLECALSEDVEPGCYYSDCLKSDWKENALDDGVAKKLWERSEDLTGLNNLN